MIVAPRMAEPHNPMLLEQPMVYIPPPQPLEGQLGYLPVLGDTCLEMPVHIQKKHRSSSVKRVRFAEAVTCHEAASEPSASCWYQREDFERIKEDSRCCIIAYHRVGRKASQLPKELYCIRGLENSLSRSTNQLVRYTRKETIMAVLIAQKGYPDSRHIRRISEFKSRDKVKDAIRMAAKDSRIWLEEYQDLQR